MSGMALATGLGLAAVPAASAVPLTSHRSVIARTMLSVGAGPANYRRSASRTIPPGTSGCFSCRCFSCSGAASGDGHRTGPAILSQTPPAISQSLPRTETQSQSAKSLADGWHDPCRLRGTAGRPARQAAGRQQRHKALAGSPSWSPWPTLRKSENYRRSLKETEGVRLGDD